MFKKIFTLISILISLAIPDAINANDCQHLIRVGISNNNFSKYVYNTADFSATGDFEIIDLQTGEIVSNLKSNTTVRISLKDGLFNVYKGKAIIGVNFSGPLIIQTKTNCLLSVNNITRAGKPALYRGVFEIVKSNGKDNLFSIVNVLDMESYLKGVVPNEMPVTFGLEALKAQTVAARNYALKPRERFYKEFDVCDSVASQVYFGANTEKDLSNLAIKQTNGLVALSPDEELIMALYSSTAGGYTENYELAFSDPKTKMFPANPIPHLKAKPDNPNIKPLNKEEDAKAFYLSYPDTFDNQSPYFRWEREWSIEELEQVLKTTLIAQSKTGFVKPALKNTTDFGNLKEIKVTKRGDSGKIVTLQIITDKDTFTVSKELVIRRTFQKNGKALPSGNFVIDTIKLPTGEKVIFHGGGFGHGVGLSQFGASSMAAKGYSFDEILQHYYAGISIATLPATIFSDDCKNSADQMFFAPYKKAYLCIDNKSGINSLTAIINGKELKIDLSSTFQRKLRIDISDYVNIGQNTIIYCIPTIENRKKSMRVYVEVKEAKHE